MSVSYPTNTMDYDARIQSMRGNNPGFSHATAFHEMIPGHNLVGYMARAVQRLSRQPDRRRAVLRRRLAALLGADSLRHGLQQDARAEGRRAVLAHAPLRADHLLAEVPHGRSGRPQDAIDFLVDRVGHERDNATAEVRRSFDPSAGYGPLYQAAYLLGGLQLRGLRQELVDSRQS